MIWGIEDTRQKKSYVNATRENQQEMTQIMKDYINERDNAQNQRNKIELHFKKIRADDSEGVTNTRAPYVDLDILG